MRILSLIIFSLPVLALVPPWNKDDHDIYILNFQLSLEQLENAFYEQGLHRLDSTDFRRAGFPEFSRNRFEDIYRHERVHVAFLSEAIHRAGADTVIPCQYRFPLENPKTFARASLDISIIVAAAYNGALGSLDNREYNVADGSIFGVESRHASWLHSALFHKNPWNTAFDSALSFRQAWTALSRYVESCPPENIERVPPQTTRVFPWLEIAARLVPGQRGQVKFNGAESAEPKEFYVVFKTGMQEFGTKLERDGSFVVPREVPNTGANFIFVTLDDKPVSDDNIAAGPRLYQFDFSSHDDTDRS